MNWYDELNTLYEDINPEASKKFWAAAKSKQIDLAAFHAAFDQELTELGLMDLFTTDGILGDKGTWSRIKSAKETNPDSWALRALSKLWALVYIDKVPYDPDTSAAIADREAAEKAEREAARARLEADQKAAQEASFKEHQDLLKTYVTKIDPKLVTAYEEAAGIPVDQGVYLSNKGKAPRKDWVTPPATKYGIHFKGWNRYYPITDADIVKEDRILKILAAGFTGAAEYIRSAKFRKIDVFSVDERATVILLGDSGTLYELTGNYDGGFTVRVNGGDPVTTEVITEPYKLIFTRTDWSDGNHRTTSDSASAIYLSWNSAYADKLASHIPSKFGRTDSYLGGYTETKKVTTPDSKNYSREEGIDSWAEIYTLTGATD